jgi:UDP-N-acetylmuramate--alanine ligase
METAREVFAGRRLVVLFQPHRYSRTAALTEEFGPVFKAADVVALTDIYAAGETAVEGLTGEVLRDPIVKGSGVDVIYLPRRDDVLARMGGILRAGDVLITLGAGPVWEWGDAVMERLASRTAAVRVDES